MNYIKPEVSKPITLAVVTITDGTDGYGNREWKFRGRTPDGQDVITNVSEATALRQLARHGLTRETAIGRQLEFAAVKKGVKIFYDINLTAAAGAAPIAAAVRQVEQGTTQPRDAWTRERALFDACLDHVLTTTRPKFIEAGIAPSQDGISALVAALYLRCSERGLGAEVPS